MKTIALHHNFTSLLPVQHRKWVRYSPEILVVTTPRSPYTLPRKCHDLCCLHININSSYSAECFPEENVPFNRSAELEDKVDLPLDAVDLDNYIELCTDGIPVDLNQTIRNLTRTVSEVCAEFVIDTGDTPCNSE